jgi:dTDP-4-amino-4,6-dideoxygalactose transaminase
MKPIVMFEYGEQLAALRAELMAAVTRVLDSGTLILGPEVERFERAFAATSATGGAVGVNSGHRCARDRAACARRRSRRRSD